MTKGTLGLVVLVFVGLGAAVLALLHASVPTTVTCGFSSLACLVKEREGFAGGLIGAAGTIFAATVAWLAVRQQVAAQLDANAATRRAFWQKKLDDVDYAIGSALRAQHFVDGLRASSMEANIALPARSWENFRLGLARRQLFQFPLAFSSPAQPAARIDQWARRFSYLIDVNMAWLTHNGEIGQPLLEAIERIEEIGLTIPAEVARLQAERQEIESTLAKLKD